MDKATSSQEVPVKTLGREVVESFLLLTITVCTLGGYVGVVMALVQAAN
jgi:hypothetical protein